jgi:hypothetical protein
MGHRAQVEGGVGPIHLRITNYPFCSLSVDSRSLCCLTLSYGHLQRDCDLGVSRFLRNLYSQPRAVGQRIVEKVGLDLAFDHALPRKKIPQ